MNLHPNWWTSWGFWELDDKLLELAKEMNLSQAQEDIMTNAKKATAYGLELKPKNMLFKFDLACLMSISFCHFLAAMFFMF